MAKASSQKFINRNRAPRVHIEYDVELYGAEKKVELPFVVGVMADLSGKPAEPLPAVADRKFLEIDMDNFDDRLKAAKPRVAFTVPNTLTGEGNMQVEMTFQSMDDFSPAAVARKVDALNQLLTARTELANLLTYMDGKGGAEELVSRLLADPTLMQSLAAAPKPEAAPAESK
jgi:type VI secretion system protein ImpB